MSRKEDDALEPFEGYATGAVSPATSEANRFHPLQGGHGPLKTLVDSNFLKYASYVICDRAIPALEDGLKPVQRRILHALKEKDDGRFVKVANIVGHTMQYHPHGDVSIAEALVTLVGKRYLIEGQGNFGNIYTGDRAAASRYIECRLTPLAREEVFNKELTEWIPSYDGRNQEPVILPSKLPLMLMLGADGIAVGLSTTIFPHNFIELLKAQVEILHEKSRSPADLNLLPDFQTGGLMDVSEYAKGNGRIKLRGKVEPRKTNRLVITELPHGVTTEALISSIEEAVKKKKVPVCAINDFTAGEAEVELTLSPGTDRDRAIEALFAFTKCEVSVSSRLVCLRNNRPVEVNVDDVLRENTLQLLDILERELNLKKARLLDELHNKTLIQIFVENRIYKKIEQCKTSAAVNKAIEKGLDPFSYRLRRPIGADDIDMLLGVRIKRISLFDIGRNQKDIEGILADLAGVEKKLGAINSHATRYLRRLIREYKDRYPRRTQVTGFKEVEVRALTATEIRIKQDTNGYIGTAVKGETIFECSSLDKLIFVFSNGRYQVMPPPGKLFVDGDLARCEIFDRDKLYTAVYTEKNIAYIKRFRVGGTVMNRNYFLSAGEKSKLLLLVNGTPDALFVKYKPARNQRVRQQSFRLADIAVKSARTRGTRLTAKPIKYIGFRPGRWWDRSGDGDASDVLR